MSRVRSDIVVKRLQMSDLANANHVFRLGFAAQYNYQDPEKFAPGFSLHSRFVQEPEGVFGAFLGDELVAIGCCSIRGSVGVFGPASVKPQLWGSGIGKQILEAALQYFKNKGITYLGLSTFAESVKHVAMYYKYGYRPRFLMASMSKPIDKKSKIVPTDIDSQFFSKLSSSDKAHCLVAARQLTGGIFTGLRFDQFIQAVDELNIGDTILIYAKASLVGFAVCHYGDSSEAETGSCYIKVAAIHQSSEAASHFDALMNRCVSFAQTQNASELFAGINTIQEESLGIMLWHGFKIESLTVTMHKPNQAFYDRPDTFVIDHWR